MREMLTFPLWPIAYGLDGEPVCGCGDRACNRIGKHPAYPYKSLRAPGSQSVASWDPAQGRGVATGLEFGVFVVDLDVKPERGIHGTSEFGRLCERHGEVPNTLIVRTPTGGMHLYFRHPGNRLIANSQSKIAPGIDIRGEGGFVCAPGSPHRNGTKYEILENIPIADPPAWLLEHPALVGRASARVTLDGSEAPDPIDVSSAEGAYRLHRLHALCTEEHPPAIAGQNGHGTLLDLALWAMRDAALPIDAAYREIADHYSPRCIPPWSDAEILHKLEDALSKSSRPFNSLAPIGLEEILAALAAPEALRAGRVAAAVEADKQRHAPRSHALYTPAGKAAGTPLGAVIEALGGRVEIEPTEEQAAAWSIDPTPPPIVEEVDQEVVAEVERKKAPTPGWKYRFFPASYRPSDGKAKDAQRATLAQVAEAFLHPDWLGVWSFDSFRNEIRAIDPPCKLDAETPQAGVTTLDISRVRIWLEAHGLAADAGVVGDAIAVAASRCTHDSLVEYLDSIPPFDPAAEPDPIAGFVKALRVDCTQSHFPAHLVAKFLVGAVRRARNPGEQMDQVLILRGRTGLGKTTAARLLFGEFFRSQMPELKGRDASHAIEGFWGIEFGELDRMLRAESSTAKDFISRDVEHYRGYGNGDRITYRRRCVFLGTTNADDFLRDETAGVDAERRYWPVLVADHVDRAWIGANRDRIWAAADALAKMGVPHHLTTEAEALELKELQRACTETDDWDASIAAFCKGKQKVTTADAWAWVSRGAGLVDLDRRTRVRLCACLRRIGCSAITSRDGHLTRRDWLVPPELAGARPVAPDQAPIAPGATRGAPVVDFGDFLANRRKETL